MISAGLDDVAQKAANAAFQVYARSVSETVQNTDSNLGDVARIIPYSHFRLKVNENLAKHGDLLEQFGTPSSGALSASAMCSDVTACVRPIELHHDLSFTRQFSDHDYSPSPRECPDEAGDGGFHLRDLQYLDRDTSDLGGPHNDIYAQSSTSRSLLVNNRHRARLLSTEDASIESLASSNSSLQDTRESIAAKDFCQPVSPGPTNSGRIDHTSSHRPSSYNLRKRYNDKEDLSISQFSSEDLHSTRSRKRKKSDLAQKALLSRPHGFTTAFQREDELETERCQSHSMVYSEQPWSSTRLASFIPSLKLRDDLIQPRVLAFIQRIGDAECLSTVLGLIFQDTPALPDVDRDTSAATIYARIKRTDQSIGRLGLQQWLDIHRLSLDLSSRNLDHFVDMTQERYGGHVVKPRGNPRNRSKADVTSAMMRLLVPRLEESTQQYESERRHVKLLRRFGHRLAQFAESFGIGSLCLAFCASTIERECPSWRQHVLNKLSDESFRHVMSCLDRTDSGGFIRKLGSMLTVVADFFTIAPHSNQPVPFRRVNHQELMKLPKGSEQLLQLMEGSLSMAAD